MRGYRFLIVDDDAVDRRLYSKLLSQLGPQPCHIEEAADGASALELLRTAAFDCVLLDFMLPGMTGLEFLTLATVDGEPPCAVVLVTGQGNEAIAVEAMKRGAQDYLVKDQVNASSLWRAITQAITQVELRQRLAASLRDLTAANEGLGQEVAIRKAAEVEMGIARDAADEASQAKTRFVAMVSHELRTPLHGILGYAQILRIEGGLSARQDERLGAMMQAGRHLLDMIERVLDFASIEAGRIHLHPAPVSVRELTEACITAITSKANERGLSLRVVNAHDAPLHIVADPPRLRHVILNLLGNAVKYTDAGGVELRVLAGATRGALRVEVADTGRGIEEASRDRLFQVFERLDAASSVEGTGLGLAIAGRIIGLMGGTIHYDPAPTGGSVFWFELPVADPGSRALAAPVASASPQSGQRVLVVDDIKINLDIISSFLNAAGRVVILADSGAESVRLATEQRFDLILMDVRMPEMDGLEATRRIRLLPGAHGEVPILALTAYTSLEQIAQCLDAGMDGHVPKPVDQETLIRAIDDAISRGPSCRIGLLPEAIAGVRRGQESGAAAM
ncbi:MAG: response regulator [Rhodopila sp.]